MKSIRIHAKDNVQVQLEGENAGHKIALCDMPTGTPVIKYGCPIGITTKPVQTGDWIHSHNLHTGLSEKLDYTYTPNFKKVTIQTTDTFRGYVRSDGQVGIRNEIWILPTVGCINGVAQRLAEMARSSIWPETYAFPHPYGCSQLGDDLVHTQKLLASLAHHPNAGGVLLLGLGCENNQMEVQLAALGSYDEKRIRHLECQAVEDEIETGLEILKDLATLLSQDQRETVGADRLVIGCKCGGSDGFSGITANPLIGRITDRCVVQGGKAVMTEVPEMFGAETILMDRCVNRETFDKLVSMINGFKDYFVANGQPVYENPSPGNKKGGITTLEEKSLGCTQKSGDVPVEDVLDYGERVARPGLSLLWAPGNDLVASTACAAAGCQMVLFSTGRGTPYGTCVPTLKIATNGTLASRKDHWIDFSAHEVLEGVSMEEAAGKLWEQILKVANGELVQNEKNGCKDIAIFKTGITL